MTAISELQKSTIHSKVFDVEKHWQDYFLFQKPYPIRNDLINHYSPFMEKRAKRVYKEGFKFLGCGEEDFVSQFVLFMIQDIEKFEDCGFGNNDTEFFKRINFKVSKFGYDCRKDLCFSPLPSKPDIVVNQLRNKRLSIYAETGIRVSIDDLIQEHNKQAKNHNKNNNNTRITYVKNDYFGLSNYHIPLNKEDESRSNFLGCQEDFSNELIANEYSENLISKMREWAKELPEDLQIMFNNMISACGTGHSYVSYGYADNSKQGTMITKIKVFLNQKINLERNEDKIAELMKIRHCNQEIKKQTIHGHLVISSSLCKIISDNSQGTNGFSLHYDDSLNRIVVKRAYEGGCNEVFVPDHKKRVNVLQSLLDNIGNYGLYRIYPKIINGERSILVENLCKK